MGLVQWTEQQASSSKFGRPWSIRANSVKEQNAVLESTRTDTVLREDINAGKQGQLGLQWLHGPWKPLRAAGHQWKNFNIYSLEVWHPSAKRRGKSWENTCCGVEVVPIQNDFVYKATEVLCNIKDHREPIKGCAV